jgi:hypothetical protein
MPVAENPQSLGHFERISAHASNQTHRSNINRAVIATQVTAAEPHGRAYLFRGMIDVIDWGMDQLAERINHTGVAANISSHLMWRSVADQAISDYRRDPKPITAIGHSIGGDAAVEFAECLESAHVPVSLLVTYDPNRFAHSVPANVHRYINLTSPPTFWAAATSRLPAVSMVTMRVST